MAKETYTLVGTKDGKKQRFTDGREAGLAFSRAPDQEKPVMIKSVEGRGAQFLGSTAESWDKDTGKHTFNKTVSYSDTAFREGWEKGEREKSAAELTPAEKERRDLQTEQERLASREKQGDKSGQTVSYSKDGAGHQAQKADEGKSYQGLVIAVTAAYIIQRHIDASTGKEVDIAHDKAAVSNFKDTPESEGKYHQISYPHGKAGLAKEINPQEVKLEKQATQDYHKEGSFAAKVATAKNDVAEGKAMGTGHLASRNELADFKYASATGNAATQANQAKKSTMERER